MSNPWIQHVKRFANENNISYACAIPLAKKTYRHNVNQEEESYNYLQNAIYLKNLMKLNERLNEIDKSIKLLTYEKSNVRKRKSICNTILCQSLMLIFDFLKYTFLCFLIKTL